MLHELWNYGRSGTWTSRMGYGGGTWSPARATTTQQAPMARARGTSTHQGSPRQAKLATQQIDRSIARTSPDQQNCRPNVHLVNTPHRRRTTNEQSRAHSKKQLACVPLGTEMLRQAWSTAGGQPPKHAGQSRYHRRRKQLRHDEQHTWMPHKDLRAHRCFPSRPQHSSSCGIYWSVLGQHETSRRRHDPRMPSEPTRTSARPAREPAVAVSHGQHISHLAQNREYKRRVAMRLRSNSPGFGLHFFSRRQKSNIKLHGARAAITVWGIACIAACVWHPALPRTRAPMLPAGSHNSRNAPRGTRMHNRGRNRDTHQCSQPAPFQLPRRCPKHPASTHWPGNE